MIERRPLGATDLSVSAVGFGAWGIGGTLWIGADDRESLDALRHSFDLGINFVDTAWIYGDGHSEMLVGRAIRESGSDVHVATKVPPKHMRWPGGGDVDEAYPAAWIRQCTDDSLTRLGVDTIDVQQFHSWSDEWLGEGGWQDCISDLKHSGKIRAFGVSINNHEPWNALRLVDSGIVDTVQVIYNIFDQSPEDALFDATETAGVGVIVRVPFDEGSLTGAIRPDTEFPNDDFRNHYFAGNRKREVWERAQAIAADLDRGSSELAELALRFTLTHPGVSTVIPGMRSVRHVEANVAAARKGRLPAREIEALRRHRWNRNFY